MAKTTTLDQLLTRYDDQYYSKHNRYNSARKQQPRIWERNSIESRADRRAVNKMILRPYGRAFRVARRLWLLQWAQDDK